MTSSRLTENGCPNITPDHFNVIFRNLIFVLLIDLTVWYSVFTSGTQLPLYMRAHQQTEGTIGFVIGLLSIGALLARVSLGWAIDRFGRCAFFLAGSAFVGLLPLLGEKYQVVNIGLLVSIRGLGTIPSRLTSGFISDHRGFASVIIPGYLLGTFAIFLVPLINDGTTPYFISLLFGLGMGFVSPTMTSWTMSRVPSAVRATAVSSYAALAESAGFLGTWLMDISLESNTLYGFYILGTIHIIGFMLYLFTLKSNFTRRLVKR
jgi:MFS family permease